MAGILSSPRLLAVALLLAAPLWAVASAYSAEAAGGATTVLALSEDAWQAVLTPALLVLVAATGRWALRAPTGPSLVTLGGVTLLLVGNVLQHGLTGRAMPVWGLGWPIFVAGATVSLLGMALTFGFAARSASGRRSVGVAAGVGSAVGVALMALAAPPAAALAAVPLVDALWRAPAASVARTGDREPARRVVAA